VQPHQALYDGQAESEPAVAPGGVAGTLNERLEEVREELCIQTLAVVPHPHHELITLGRDR
jgi:hypothetical protein